MSLWFVWLHFCSTFWLAQAVIIIFFSVNSCYLALDSQQKLTEGITDSNCRTLCYICCENRSLPMAVKSKEESAFDDDHNSCGQKENYGLFNHQHKAYRETNIYYVSRHHARKKRNIKKTALVPKIKPRNIKDIYFIGDIKLVTNLSIHNSTKCGLSEKFPCRYLWKWRLYFIIL